jgi:hypothetical protein
MVSLVTVFLQQAKSSSKFAVSPMVSTAVATPGKFVLVGVSFKGSWDLPLHSYSTGCTVSIFWSKKLLHRASFLLTSVDVGVHTVASEIILHPYGLLLQCCQFGVVLV